MYLNEIKKHEIWSIENMEHHAGNRMHPEPAAVEFLGAGAKKYAFVYYRTEDGRFWYKSVSETEGIRIMGMIQDDSEAVPA